MSGRLSGDSRLIPHIDQERPRGPSNPPLGYSQSGDLAEILDACCGGRMWWWDKDHPLAVYMDNREAPRGTRADRPNWNVEPDILGDFRAMPFTDGAFRLVVFDPPHIVRDALLGNVSRQYGALPKATEQDDLRRGFAECWRVLAPGGTLVFKWAGDVARVQPYFPATPIVGTRSAPRGNALGTRWFVFYKSLGAETEELADAV